jgi:glycosyltransferase involved in cell wall biosynthesis
MKILYFTKYTRRGASSRLRSYQYFPYLEEQGITITVSPFFGNCYLDNLYARKSTLRETIKAYLHRFWVLRKVVVFDRILVEKEVFPYFPALAEKLFSLFGIKYIVDYDDAIFHNYDMSSNPLIRFCLKNKIDRVIKYSGTTVVGNSYLADRAKKAGAKNIAIIPTVVDLNRYSLKHYDKMKQVVIGWIGTQSTFKYLLTIKNVLLKLVEQYNIKVCIIGANQSLGLGGNEIHINWSEKTEVQSIMNCDIGIMPLLNTPWELGKCGYKLIQYMACGLPVVASAVGANKDIVKENTGILVSDNEEWYNALKYYITNFDIRRKNGMEGRKLVGKKYCVEKQLNKYINIFVNDNATC